MKLKLDPKIFATYRADLCHGHWLGNRPRPKSKGRIAILLIPKNASQTISRNCSDAWRREFTRHNHDSHIINYVVLLRDPLRRWVSGVVEYCVRNNKDIRTLDLDKMIFDEHTVPQFEHCYFINPDKCDFYVLEDNGIQEIYENYNIKSGNIENANEAKEIKAKHAPTKWLKNYVSKNPAFRQKIKKFYARDYSIIKQYYKERYQKS